VCAVRTIEAVQDGRKLESSSLGGPTNSQKHLWAELRRKIRLTVWLPHTMV